MRGAPLLLLLGGCPQEGSVATWLDGFGFRWGASNHRLSAWQASADGPVAEVGVIGGTSTTGVVFGRGDTCPTDGGGCGELPVKDSWDLTASWVHATSDRVELASATVSAVVGADGARATAAVKLPHKVRSAEAWIASVALETGVAQDLPSCYDPRHGWNPRRIGVQVGEASVDGDVVTVPVDLQFEAGLTLEDLRSCLDAAAPDARVGIEVGVVVVGLRKDVPVDVLLVEQENEVPFEPDVDQSAPAGQAWSPVGDLYGWRALSWWFHEGDPDDRGAYLRSLSFAADPLAGEALGWATNDAPPILLQSGFQFRFEGELVSVDADAEVERYVAFEEDLAADVDEQGHALPWEVQGAP